MLCWSSIAVGSAVRPRRCPSPAAFASAPLDRAVVGGSLPVSDGPQSSNQKMKAEGLETMATAERNYGEEVHDIEVVNVAFVG